MYFESNRSSDDGMLAVGTVVMNRLQSGKYPSSVCGVVGQRGQFAPGVLSKPMKEGQSRERALRVADMVLRGKRHRGVGEAMFFHTAGYNFPYTNMHYQVIAGGNAFYEKRRAAPGQRNRTQMEVARASRRSAPRAGPHRSRPVAQPVELAAATFRAAESSRRRTRPATAATAFGEAPPILPAESIEALILASGG